MLRAAVYESNQCQYYIKKSNEVVIGDRNLSDIDKLVQNAVYDSQGGCPDGWSSEVTICTMDSMDEDVCNEYASFLEVTFEFTCMIPLMSVNYTCPNESYALGSFSDGHYCYIVIPKYTENPNNLTYYDRSNQYCQEVTGGYLASIHSADENTLLNNLQMVLGNGTNGMIIGLVSRVTVVVSEDDFYWQDGTDVDYTNYVDSGLVSGTDFMLTVMPPNSGLWQPKLTYLSAPLTFKCIGCKQSAKAILTSFQP